MQAYNEFIEATRQRADGVNDDVIQLNSSTKLTRLVFDVARSLRFKLRETDIQTSAYESDGWRIRANIAQNPQQAMRAMANILLLQPPLLADETVEQRLDKRSEGY